MPSPLRLPPAAVLALTVWLAAREDGGLSTTPTPSPTGTAVSSPTATPAAGIGSYDDPYDFRSFAAQLSNAIDEALKESRPTVLDIVTEATPIFEVASLQRGGMERQS